VDPVPVAAPEPGPPSGWGGTAAAGQRIDDGRGRIFPCHGCGADLQYHVGDGELACPFCGARRPVELDPDAAISERDFRAELDRQAALRAEARRAGPAAGGQPGADEDPDAGTADADAAIEIRCDACGADVVFDRTLSSTECAFCGSPLQREDAHTAVERVPVDGVLPFGITREQARAALASWVRSRWFAPTEFRRRGVKGRFNGVYLPFWTFDSHTATSFRGRRGDHYWVTTGSGKNRRRVRRTRWRPVSGRFERFFDDVLVLASEGHHRSLVRGLEPWPLTDVRPFDRRLLAGFLARTYDVELGDGFVHARERIDEALRADVRRRIGGDEQRITHLRSTYDPVTYKHLLLPLWLLSYRWGDRTFQVVVNARTGEVQGERPWSWVKITLAVLAGLALVGGLAWLRARAG
jgi:DNA-directed RNA polymerase subunit RPC12/RpoP